MLYEIVSNTHSSSRGEKNQEFYFSLTKKREICVIAWRLRLLTIVQPILSDRPLLTTYSICVNDIFSVFSFLLSRHQ